jgi:hypothetical protein
MEEKPFTSSLNICPGKLLHKGVGVGEVTPPPHYHHPVSHPVSVDISFKDDVTVILLLGASFMIAELEFIFRWPRCLYIIQSICVLHWATSWPLFILSYSAPKFGVCACPFVGIGSPHPLPPSEFVPSLNWTQRGEEQHSLVG